MAKTKKLLDKSLSAITQSNRIEIGFVSTDDASTKLIELVLPHLENSLEEIFPDYKWKLEFIEQKSEDSSGHASVYFFEIARDVLVRRRLDFAFTVSSGDLGSVERVPDRALVATALSSAVIPGSYLALPGRTVSQMIESETTVLNTRFNNFFLHLLGLLMGLGESQDDLSVMRSMNQPGTFPDAELSYNDLEIKQIEPGLDRIARKKSFRIAPEVGKILLYFKVVFFRPGQVLKGAWGNKPWKFIFKLHKLVFPAVVAIPLALFAEELWSLGTNIAYSRIIAIGAAIVIGVTAFIVLKQKLLMRMPPGGLSERVAVFNLSSILSILIAVTLVLAVIFICTLAITTGVFPHKIVSNWLGVERLNFGDYAKVSLFIACLASVVGWLGAGFTESDDFRLMLYTNSR